MDHLYRTFSIVLVTNVEINSFRERERERERERKFLVLTCRISLSMNEASELLSVQVTERSYGTIICISRDVKVVGV